MSQRLYTKLAMTVQTQTGIQLGEQKMDLIRARIAKRMRALRIPDLQQYCHHLDGDDNGTEMVHLLDAVSTNVTSFFREADHYDVLAKMVNQWVADGRKQLRIWSAGCSSGEEPYTMAMVLHEHVDLAALNDVKILATDISTAMLEKARRAVYPKRRIEGLPRSLLTRYFQRNQDRDKPLFRVKEPLRRMMTFRRFNFMDMMETTPPFKGPFDVIFCRNVMIYFDVPTRQRLVECYADLLKPGGLFCTGRAESLTGLTHNLKIVEPSAYVK